MNTISNLFNNKIGKVLNEITKDIIFLKEYEDNVKKIQEGLIKTYPCHSVINSSRVLFDGSNIDKEFECLTNGLIVLRLKTIFNEEFLKSLMKYLNLCGYYISRYNITIKRKGLYRFDESFNYVKFISELDKIKDDFIRIDFVCEPKFDETIHKLPSELYHVTTLENYEKIKKIGLKPTSKSDVYPDRVYFCTNIKSAESLITQYNTVKFNKNFVILKITTNGLNLKDFMYDPNFNELNGIYTYQNIPPSRIELIK